MLIRPIPLLAIAISLISNVAFAQPTNNPDNKPHQPRNAVEEPLERNELIDKLNLTNDQQQKMAQIREKYQGQIAENWQTLRSGQQQLIQMMTSTDSVETIRSKYQEIVQLRQQLYNLTFERMLEMREVLTVDQRKQLATLMQQRRGNKPNKVN